MFRGTGKSALSDKNFSVGSTIKFGDFESYLLVADGMNGIVAVSLQTFEIVARGIVHDQNHLSEEEARMIVRGVAPDATFSDAELNTRGLKK